MWQTDKTKLKEYFMSQIWGIVLAKIGDGIYPVYSENGSSYLILNVVLLKAIEINPDDIELWTTLPEPEEAEE